MKKIILILCSIILYASHARASQQCFIAKERDRIIHNEGDCYKPYSPCDTFEIALILMGYDKRYSY